MTQLEVYNYIIAFWVAVAFVALLIALSEVSAKFLEEISRPQE